MDTCGFENLWIPVDISIPTGYPYTGTHAGTSIIFIQWGDDEYHIIRTR